jgi:hypothetical protein
VEPDEIAWLSSGRVRPEPARAARPASGALGELQRFLNTNAYSGRPDTLAVTLAHVDPDADDLAHLHRVREGLRALLLTGFRGAELPTRPTGPGTCSTVTGVRGSSDQVAALVVAYNRIRPDTALRRR